MTDCRQEIHDDEASCWESQPHTLPRPLPSNSDDKVWAVKRVAERAKHCFLFPIPTPQQHSIAARRLAPSLPLFSTDFIADSEKSNMQLRTEMAPLSPPSLPPFLALSCLNWARLARSLWPRKSRSRRGYGLHRPIRHRGTAQVGQCWENESVIGTRPQGGRKHGRKWIPLKAEVGVGLNNPFIKREGKSCLAAKCRGRNIMRQLCGH